MSSERIDIGLLEKELFRAIEALEPTIRGEFERAREIVPEIVRQETRPLTFLRCEGYDPAKAALRLAHYWKLRKELFKER